MRTKTTWIMVIMTSLLISMPKMATAEAAKPKVTSVTTYLTGVVTFSCDYTPQVLENRGYSFHGKGKRGPLMTNLFGVPGARIIIRNERGEIIATGKSGLDGKYKIMVPTAKFYQIETTFRERKTEFFSGVEFEVKIGTENEVNLHTYYFKTREVDSWESP